MSDTAKQTERLDHFLVHFLQGFCVCGIAFDGSRRKHAASMRNIEGRNSIGMGIREQHFSFIHHAVHVENAAWHELFEQKVRLFVAEFIQPGPKFVRLVDFLHADAGGLRALVSITRELEREPCSLAVHHDLARVQIQGRGRRLLSRAMRMASLSRKYRTVVSPHARNAQVFADGRDILHVEFISATMRLILLCVRRNSPRLITPGSGNSSGMKKHFVDCFMRPVRMAQLFYRQEINAAGPGPCRCAEIPGLFRTN